MYCSTVAPPVSAASILPFRLLNAYRVISLVQQRALAGEIISPDCGSAGLLGGSPDPLRHHSGVLLPACQFADGSKKGRRLRDAAETDRHLRAGATWWAYQ
jgi:hypothetical protein